MIIDRKNKEKKKEKKEDENDDNKGKIRKDSKKKKWKFHGEELLGPQASLRVTPCPPAPNHTRGEVIRPPSQIKNNSYSVIRTRDLDDLSCTRCTPTNSVTFRSSSTLLVIAVVFVYKTQGYWKRYRKKTDTYENLIKKNITVVQKDNCLEL